MVDQLTIKQYQRMQGISRATAESNISLAQNTPINGVSDTVTIPLFASNIKITLFAIRIFTDTEIADGDESNNYSFQLRNLTDGEDIGDPVTTSGEGNGVAQYGFITLDAEQTNFDRDILFGVVITKTGSPTDLSSAKLISTASYKDRDSA